MDRDCGTATVVQAQAGDRHATDELIGSHLPLVYNIVGRALSGHPDTDDVVQETMLHAVDGLPSLREPASFRSWLVAIAMNQIRRRHQSTQAQQAQQAYATGSGAGDAGQYGAGGYGAAGTEPADPGADFVNLTIVRLGLSGQRREVAEATRWLDEDDRELLALWWQEAAGQLTRAELAAALGMAPQHAAVRVQRMKNQLENARVVVRALSAAPLCWQLAETTATWDGSPGTLWRKRIARHARECGYCAQQRDGLFPAEGLLAGLALVPVPHGQLASGALTAAFSAQPTAAHVGGSAPAGGSAGPAGSADTAAAAHGGAPTGGDSAGPAGHSAGHSAGHRAHRHAAGRGRRALPKSPKSSRSRRLLLTALGTAAVTAAAVGVVGAEQEHPNGSVTQADAVAAPPDAVPAFALGPAAAPSAVPSSASASPSPSGAPSSAAPSSAAPSPTSSPSSSAGASSPTPSPTRTATRTASSPTAAPAIRQTAPSSIQQQVIDLVNTERSKAGCGPVRNNSKLQAAAQGHSDDMAARNFFDHTNPDGAGPQARIEAAGYQWSTWGENIARGQSDPAAVMDSWMHSPGHRANILNCAFTELGVGVHQGSGGPWWTQDFGAPS
ncbi:sigma-70 family RNA polymerase sigma factor [Kitasatospora sp. NPDC056138]|uniref:sigma-70 family RNA polymerase sigma factor n=1 Tax=Kitasatospora sp. NPDC056138 TaxID=3345724 RepID=UPI0035D86A01